MTAQPQNRPLPGPMPVPASPPPMPMAPPMAFGQMPAALEPTTTARPSSGASRLAKSALMVSLLVAVGGVSFALGRASVEETSTGRAAIPFTATAPQAEATTVAGAAVAVEPATEGAVASASSTAEDATTTGGARTSTAAAASLSDGSAGTTVTDLAAADALGGAPADRLGGAGMDGPPGGVPGRGAVQGTVADIIDSALVVTLGDGSTQTVPVDATTEWLRQQSITPDDVVPGDTVSVQMPFAGFGSDDGSSSTVAAQVTVTTAAP